MIRNLRDLQDPIEILVIDDCSDDGTPQKARALGLRVIGQTRESKGLTLSWNTAWAYFKFAHQLDWQSLPTDPGDLQQTLQRLQADELSSKPGSPLRYVAREDLPRRRFGAVVISNNDVLMSQGSYVAMSQFLARTHEPAAVGPLTTTAGIGTISARHLKHQILEELHPHFAKRGSGRDLVKRLPESLEEISRWLKRRENSDIQVQGGGGSPVARRAPWILGYILGVDADMIGPRADRKGEFDSNADQLFNPALKNMGGERDLLVDRGTSAYVLPYVFAFHNKATTVGHLERKDRDNLALLGAQQPSTTDPTPKVEREAAPEGGSEEGMPAPDSEKCSSRLALLFFGKVGNMVNTAGRAASDLHAPRVSWESIQRHIIQPNLEREQMCTDVFVHTWDTHFKHKLEQLYRPALSEYSSEQGFHKDPWINKHIMMFTSIRRVVRLKIKYEQQRKRIFTHALLLRFDTWFRRDWLLSTAPLSAGTVITGTHVAELAPVAALPGSAKLHPVSQVGIAESYACASMDVTPTFAMPAGFHRTEFWLSGSKDMDRFSTLVDDFTEYRRQLGCEHLKMSLKRCLYGHNLSFLHVLKSGLTAKTQLLWHVDYTTARFKDCPYVLATAGDDIHAAARAPRTQGYVCIPCACLAPGPAYVAGPHHNVWIKSPPGQPPRTPTCIPLPSQQLTNRTTAEQVSVLFDAALSDVRSGGSLIPHTS
ncbi:hypothetical protein CYMTET_54195 [Cymbomonas tetramitiformis]|uniref:Glycosyltransferase 2-like domain-containing protein n=1 Tax=Cymbomonas tetramitiformis TaxID=36881 RepID=A0AAE0BGP4_9CHLO|nr:hypothetical protein CYMTET_54195 [Cymbomonas tetramitiformis]